MVTTRATVTYSFPAASAVDVEGSDQVGFNMNSAGTGSFTGLAYSVPAHAEGSLKAQIQTLSLTSDQVDSLNKLIMSMLSASEQEKIEEHRQISASADLSFFEIICGGAKASFDDTRSSMHSMGLSDEQITTIVNAMAEDAQKMNTVELNFTIDNTLSDYSVEGDLQLYTVSGTISAGKESFQYRMLSNEGKAGSDGSAPAKGTVENLK